MKKDTLLSLKKHIISACRLVFDETRCLLGGVNREVQVDESLICRRGTIRSPKSTSDGIRDTTWIIGGIDNSIEKNVFIVVAPNRRSETIEEILRQYVHLQSKLLTDGYPSYPRAAQNLNLLHSVVDHSRVFINEQGENTNGIEGLWSNLKGKMRASNGVKRADVSEFGIEFQFKKKFLKNKSSAEIPNAFSLIIKKLLI